MKLTPINQRLGIAVLVVAIGSLIWFMNTRPSMMDETGSNSRELVPPRQTSSTTTGQDHFGSSNKSEPLSSAAEKLAIDSTSNAESKQTILEKIHEASITYDPAQLPAIRGYLVHPEAEIREAAVNGMIVLGDASAGPMLREAAKLAPTAKEAVVMEEAADYVELPSANLGELLKKKNSKKDWDLRFLKK